MKNLKLLLNHRKELAKPIGKLISGKREDTIKEVVELIKKETEDNPNVEIRLYCVGDIVTHDFLNNDFLFGILKICIVDEKTKRESVELPFNGVFEKYIELENPAGTISSEVWPILKYFVEEDINAVVNITEGEEDLLVLPLISEISLKKDKKDYIFYGQPPITDANPPIPEGIVMVEVNEQTKSKVEHLISLMEEY